MSEPRFIADPESCDIYLCHCGCGGGVSIARRNDRRDGVVRGQPMRFISGHHNRPATGPPDLKLFLSHIRRGAHDQCWPWDSSTMRRGYGRWLVQRGWKRTRFAAHRLAYDIANGPIPEGLLVCHHCDNPPCCNPTHLFLGTNADNLADMTAKGRRVIPHPPVRRGTDNGNAKLNEGQVREIRLNPDQLGTSALGRRYGVSPSAIRFVQIGRSWASVR